MSRSLPEFRKHGFDSKFVPLSPAEASGACASSSRQPLVRFIETWSSTPLSNLRILDLGCGRGDLVAELRSKGARAFGVEVDPRFIESGRVLSDLYHDEFPLLTVLEPTGRSVFPDNYFDLVVSDQVLEHVASLAAVVREIARVLRPGGRTCHHFPARFRVIEPHYRLPCVHWLPKNTVRRTAIKALLAAGLSSEFFPEYGLDDRASIIFKYSVEETFYRPIAEIRREFEANGLRGTFADGMQAYVESRLHRSVPVTIARLVAAFRMVMFTAEKPQC